MPIPTHAACAVLLTLAMASCHAGSPPTDAPVASRTPPDAESPSAPVKSAPASRLPEPSAWATATSARVQGAELLGCRARELPGFIELTCGAPNYFGSPATRVIADPERIVAGRAATHSENGRTRLVFAWNEGTELLATYDFLMPVVFEAEWPRGAKEPEFVGRFRGVPDFPTAKVAAFVCQCVAFFEGKSAPPGCKLGDEFTAFGGALECLRAHYPSDCQGYRECITMEPGSYGKCESGEQYTGACPACRCAIQCGAGKPNCPPGMSCEPSQREQQGSECSLE